VAISAINELLDPSFVEGKETMPIEVLRDRRAQCQEASDVLSYLRRLVQGRLDLVLAERQRRTEGQPGDLGDVVERLKRGEIIGDHIRAAGYGRLPQTLGPADDDGWVTATLDDVLDVSRLAALPELPDDELAAIEEALVTLERRVSDQRNTLHQRTDVFQEEIVRRYKSGEATVESFFQ
jgi:hypothetical protein